MPSRADPERRKGGSRRGGQIVLAGLVVAAVVVVALVAWQRPDDDRNTVAIVGDSITERGEGVLGRRLAPDWRLRVDGRSGFTIAQQQAAAETLSAGDPSQVVVNLGTNDVLRGRSTADIEADLRRLVAAFGEADCIHVVTINTAMVSFVGPIDENAAAANQVMATMAAEDGRIDVIDWAVIVRDDQAGSQPDGPILSDTIHPTERGQEVLADAYGRALSSCAA